MPSTAVHSLRFPLLGDSPNVPLDLQRLADDVERELVEATATTSAAITAVTVPDTGWVTGADAVINTANFAAVSGHTVSIRKVGKAVFIRGMLTYVTGTFAATTMVTVSPAFRPSQGTWLGTWMSNGSKAVATYLVSSAGIINVPAVSYYSGTPAASDTIVITGSWMVD